MNRVFSCFAAVLLLSGCGATREQLVQRASFDLDCPAAQLQVHEIDGRTRGVMGCGKRAVYVSTCQRDNNTRDCTWVLNTDIAGGENPVQPSQAGPAQPPAPAPVAFTLENDLRAGLDARRDAILQCSGGQATDVLAAYSADGMVSFALVGALAGSHVEACVRQTLGPVQINTQGTSGVVQHRVAAAL